MKAAQMFYRIKAILHEFYSIDRGIISILLFFGIINIVIQISANDDIFQRVITDVIYFIISFGFLFLVVSTPINQIKRFAVHIYIFSLILLFAVLLFGIKLKGAQRWLNLGIRIQPSELCKLSVPLVLAYYFSLKNKPYRYIDYFVGFIIIIIPFAMIAKQPDLGTGILVLSAGFFVLFFAGLPWRIIIICIVAFMASTPFIWNHLHDYQQHRIITLLHPQADPLGKGYHIIQGMIAIGSGGIYGKGYLKGTQIHLNFIPEKHTDFVIAVLAEEWGYIGVCVILVLYLILIIRCLTIMQRSTDVFSKLLTGAITLSFALYVLINMGMVGGIFPVVGVPLPFISYGGTATIVLMIGFGIILIIAKQQKY